MAFPGLIGKKVGMTTVFDENGDAVPVTVLELLPLTVTQIKTPAHDGYSAIQVGYWEGKAKHLTRAELGHLKKNNLCEEGKGLRKLREFRVDEAAAQALKVGDIIDPFGDATPLASGMLVNVTANSIGKGFQGNTKRWHHGRGPMSHGSKSHRLPGSIGAGTTPGRVFKGLRMAGRMGNVTVTTKHLKVIRMMPEKHVVLIRGAVPGVEGGFVLLAPSLKQPAQAAG